MPVAIILGGPTLDKLAALAGVPPGQRPNTNTLAAPVVYQAERDELPDATATYCSSPTS